MAVKLNVLNVGQGGKDMYIEDTTPEERDALAEEVLGLMKKGFALFLIRGSDSRQITGYDKKKHEWAILADAKPAPKSKKEMVPAAGSDVKAVGQTAGG
jgi:hypothetical protein